MKQQCYPLLLKSMTGLIDLSSQRSMIFVYL